MNIETSAMRVVICRQPGSWEKGEILVDNIKDIRWDNVSGGVHAKQGAYYLYGSIPYIMAMGLVACSGNHFYGGNNAKICICKSHNRGEYAAGYAYLEALAGEKPLSIIAQNRPFGEPPCTKNSWDSKRWEFNAKGIENVNIGIWV